LVVNYAQPQDLSLLAQKFTQLSDLNIKCSTVGEIDNHLTPLVNNILNLNQWDAIHVNKDEIKDNAQSFVAGFTATATRQLNEICQ